MTYKTKADKAFGARLETLLSPAYVFVITEDGCHFPDPDGDEEEDADLFRIWDASFYWFSGVEKLFLQYGAYLELIDDSDPFEPLEPFSYTFEWRCREEPTKALVTIFDATDHFALSS